MGRQLARLAYSTLPCRKPGAAGDQLAEATQLPSSANTEAGRPVSESLNVADLKLAGRILKIAALAIRAGLSAQTLHSIIRRGGIFTPKDAAAIHHALDWGLIADVDNGRSVE